jgi:hypothetical protein
VYGLEKVLTVEGVVESMARRGENLSPEAARSLLERLRSLGTKQFVYGALCIQRLEEPHKLPPLRIGITPDAGAADFERVFAWRDNMRRGDFAEWFRNCKPRFHPDVLLTVRHGVQEGELVPGEFIFSMESGLKAAMRPDGWIVPLLARLNGNRSVSEVYQEAKSNDDLPEGFTLDDFSKLVQRMSELGFYEAAN